MLLAVAVPGVWMAQGTGGINGLFATLLLSGGLVIAAVGLYRSEARPGYYPLMAVLLLSIVAMLRASTSLEFFFAWELVTLASFFMLALAQLVAAEKIDGAVLGRGHQPGTGPVRNSGLGPLLERRDQRVLRQLLGEAHVAQHAREPRDQLRLLDAEHRFDGAMCLGHA